MAYPKKPTGNDILPFDTVFAINNNSKQVMTTGEILDGYNNDGEAETDLTSRPDANKFNMFWYQVHNTVKWLVEYIDELYKNKLELSGGSMLGSIKMGNNKITADYIPTNQNDLVNKAYIDKAMNGNMWLGEVKTLAYPKMPQLPEGVEIVPCDGRALSRKDYAELFSLLGVAFGAGDGETTFNIPDYRGLFLRGWDGNSNRDKNRIYGQIQMSGVPNLIGGPISADNRDGIGNYGCFRITGISGGGYDWGGGRNYRNYYMNAHWYSNVYQDGLTEARPINSNCYYIIRIK